MSTDYEFVRSVGRTLPGTEEGTSYGTPALKVGGTLFTRLREDGETLVVRTSFDDREPTRSTRVTVPRTHRKRS